jgi:integral membrane protein (TIGR01906 family)
MEEAATCHRGVVTRFFTVVATVLLVFATAVACIQGIAFDSSFYRLEYAKLETAEYVGVSEEELTNATEILLGYLQGKRENLDLEISLENGIQEEYYTQREKEHMVDVKALYQNAVTFMVIGYVVGSALLCVCFFAKPLRDIRKICQTYFWTVIGILLFFGAIGVYAAVDFNRFWIGFHHIFFTNDLWMLDPAASRMIRMFEETFFADLVGRILAVFLAITCDTGLLAGILNQRIKKNERY